MPAILEWRALPSVAKMANNAGDDLFASQQRPGVAAEKQQQIEVARVPAAARLALLPLAV